MGNVPAKETRSRSSSYSGVPGMVSDPAYTRSRRRNTSASFYSDPHKKSKSHEEKDRAREKHHQDLVVRSSESVDGGYLAPFGTYKSNLDYSTDVVRNLIINRRLAPFFTPLQDFKESWSEDELLVILGQLPLHSIDLAYSDEEADDIDNHKIHKSSNYYKRQEQKLKLKALIEKTKDLQKKEDEKLQQLRIDKKSGDVVQGEGLNVFSDDLNLRLYKNATECPICFLYYPSNLNYSRCCRQPICTECFVQIKRLDPHPPHDDTSNTDNNELPHTLISESANCPYCAMPDFGITYEPRKDIHTGINGTKPAEYAYINFESIPEESAISSSPEKLDEVFLAKPKPARRRSSVPADAPGVISIDTIRPDWETKLIAARNKLARKAATASAIHASNLIISDESQSRNATRRNVLSVEERMIEQALRLSLLDEEERKRKEEAKINPR